MSDGTQQTGAPAADQTTRPRVPLFLYVSFVVTGVVTTLLGPLLPVLASKWSLSDGQSGYLFTAQFGGSVAGVALSSLFIPRLGFYRTLALSFALMAVGVAALGVSAWAVGLAAVFCYGIGLGLNIPTANVLVSEANPSRPSVALNILNFAWSFGAVACPAIVALLLRWRITSPGLVGLAALTGATALGLTRLHLAPATESKKQEHPLASRATAVWRSPFIPLLGGMFFLYVGTENALSGWVASYAKRLSAEPGTAWALAPSFFWAALLAGRALAPALLRFTADTQLMIVGLLTAAFGISLLLVAKTLLGVFVGASLSGLGLASIFPIAIAMLSHCFGTAAARVAGSLFALGGLGGATLPWLVGRLSTHFGSLRVGLVVPLAGSLGMIALQMGYSRSNRRPADSGPGG